MSGTVNLLNYSESNPYIAPCDGIIYVQSNWRSGSYAIGTAVAGTMTMNIESAAPNGINDSGQNIVHMNVFKGMKLYGSRSESAPYGYVNFIPYLYS